MHFYNLFSNQISGHKNFPSATSSVNYQPFHIWALDLGDQVLQNSHTQKRNKTLGAAEAKY